MQTGEGSIVIAYNASISACEKGQQWAHTLVCSSCCITQEVFSGLVTFSMAWVGRILMGMCLRPSQAVFAEHDLFGGTCRHVFNASLPR